MPSRDWYVTCREKTDGTSIDPALNRNVSRVLPDVGAGIYIYHPNFYIGFSVPNFIKADLANKNQNGTDARRTAHIDIMMGGVIPAGKVLKSFMRVSDRSLHSNFL